MFWLRSSACQVRPPSSERYSPFFGGSASMNAYTTSGFEGATATATRPHGLVGNPAVPGAWRSVHVAPPSVLLNRPEPLGATWTDLQAPGTAGLPTKPWGRVAVA